MSQASAQALARRLRAQPTACEAKLWSLLRGRQVAGLKFRRQARIGDYVADFVCLRHRLVIEADGPFHAENAEHDARRDAWLRGEGYRVLRFSNHMIATDRGAVVGAILRAVEAPGIFGDEVG